MKRNPIVIGAVACVALVLAWYSLWYSPLGDDIDKRTNDRIAAETEHDRLSADLARLKDLARDEVNQKATLDRLQTMIPDGAKLDTLIEELNGVATEAGLSWLSVTPNRPVPGDGTVQSIAVTMNLTGRFQPVLDYLRGLAHMKRLVVVTGVTLNVTSATVVPTDASGSSLPSVTSSIDPDLSVVLSAKVFTGAASGASLTQAQESAGPLGAASSSSATNSSTATGSGPIGAAKSTASNAQQVGSSVADQAGQTATSADASTSSIGGK